jgi:hypothetical protein
MDFGPTPAKGLNYKVRGSFPEEGRIFGGRNRNKM